MVNADLNPACFEGHIREADGAGVSRRIQGGIGLFVEKENAVPVVLHADYDPTTLFCLRH